MMYNDETEYWMGRAQEAVAERDQLIQAQRDEICRVGQHAQELSYNLCMQNAIVAHEVWQFAAANCSAQASAAIGAPAVTLETIAAFLSRMTGGMLQPQVPQAGPDGADPSAVAAAALPDHEQQHQTSSASNNNSNTTGPSHTHSSGMASSAAAAAAEAQATANAASGTQNTAAASQGGQQQPTPTGANTDGSTSDGGPAHIGRLLRCGKRFRDADSDAFRPERPGQWYRNQQNQPPVA